MKFILTKASDNPLTQPREKNIKTLAELLDFIENAGDEGNGVIISKEGKNDWSITIYDDYVE